MENPITKDQNTCNMVNSIVLVDPSKRPSKSGIVSESYFVEPLGLEYVAAGVVKEGYKLKILQQKETPDDVFLGEIMAEKPDIVGFTTMTANVDQALTLASYIKQYSPQTKIVLGGIHATSNPNLIEEKTIDFIVLGEGEKTFAELVKALDKNKPVDNIEGIVFKSDREIQPLRRKRLTAQELDSIDFRTVRSFSNIVVQSKSPLPIPGSEIREAGISGSRGCMYNCKYCSSPVLWNRQFVSRSPENVVDEIEYLIESRYINTIFFRDEDVFSDSNYIKGICDEILVRGIKDKKPEFQFLIMARASKVDTELLPLLKKAGCESIGYGVESLDTTQLKNLGKKQNIYEVINVINATFRAGIRSVVYMMIGNPSETEESLRQTYDALKQIPFNRIRVAITTPFPGTRLYDEVTEKGLWLPGRKDNFSDFTAEHPLVRSNMPPDRIKHWQKKLYGLHFTEDYFDTMVSHINRDRDQYGSIASYLEFIEKLRDFGMSRDVEVPFEIMKQKLTELCRDSLSVDVREGMTIFV